MKARFIASCIIRSFIKIVWRNEGDLRPWFATFKVTNVIFPWSNVIKSGVKYYRLKRL